MSGFPFASTISFPLSSVITSRVVSVVFGKYPWPGSVITTFTTPNSVPFGSDTYNPSVLGTPPTVMLNPVNEGVFASMPPAALAFTPPIPPTPPMDGRPPATPALTTTNAS